MRMLLNVTIPHEPFNTLVREKKAGAIIGRIIEELKPEAVYFLEENGTRGAVLVVDVAEPSRIPFFAEPFFLNFNADCRFRIAMSPEDLGRAGLDDLGDKWR
ncbi:MAG: panthothenate synthetase [Acidobacteriota bacterium]